MRRTILLLAGVLLAVVALGSDSPKEYDDRTEYVGIEGTWLLVSLDSNGKRPTEYVWVQTFRNGVYTRKDDDSMVTGDYTTDTSHHPARLQETPRQSITYVASKNIYQVRGDKLTIGWRKNPGEQPMRFDEKELIIATFRRVK